MYDITGSMLKVDPNDRPNVHDIVDRLQQIAAARNVNLKGALNIADDIDPHIGLFKISVVALYWYTWIFAMFLTCKIVLNVKISIGNFLCYH